MTPNTNVEPRHSRPDGRRQAALQYLAFLTAAVVVVALSTQNVWDESGWPHNHEGLAWKFRLLVHAAHQSQGDFFPIWSSEDLHGHGTPLPLYYHKLFDAVAGGLYNLTGSIKRAVVGSVWFWLLVGTAGMQSVLRAAGASPFLSSSLALTFPLWNYTQYDWLVRAAFAEFSALAVAPWLLSWCIRTIRGGRFSFTIVPILATMFYAHSVMALYSLAPLVCCAGVAMYRHRRRRCWKAIGRAMVSAVCFFLIAAPQLAVMHALRGCFDPSHISSQGFHPCDNYRPMEKYLLDYRFLPGGKEMWNSVQINQSLWMGLTAAGLFALLPLLPRYRRSRTASRPGGRPRISMGVAVFVASTLAIVAFLQTPASSAFYQWTPGASYLQFPWRLLGFIYPLLLLAIALLFRVVETRYDKMASDILLILVLSTMILDSPALKPVRWPWYSAEELEHVPPPGRSPGAHGTHGEYWPARGWNLLAGAGDNRTEYLSQLLEQYKAWSEQGAVFQGKTRSDAVPFPERDRWEQNEFLVTVNCPEAGVLILPLTHSGLELVTDLSTTTPSRLSAYAPPNDPRMHVRLEPGEHKLLVRLPTVGDALLRHVLGIKWD